ncbi:hypothetical protein [Shouchella shacheensis]|nr:hypothetical protein [Shouchella shacheensis]
MQPKERMEAPENVVVGFLWAFLLSLPMWTFVIYISFLGFRYFL